MISAKDGNLTLVENSRGGGVIINQSDIGPTRCLLLDPLSAVRRFKLIQPANLSAFP